MAVVSHDDVPAPPDSWEVADVDDSMRLLMLSATAKQDGEEVASLAMASTEEEEHADAQKAKEDSITQVDEFLLEAQQNLRERLSVLRSAADGVSAATDILSEIGCAPYVWSVSNEWGSYESPLRIY